MDRPNLRSLVRLRPDFIDVEITGIKAADGRPLTVRCAKPAPQDIVRDFRVLPGARPAQLQDRDAPDDEQEADFLAWAPVLIEKYAAIQLEDGTWHRPAFSFADDAPEDLLPGRDLTMNDFTRLATTVMELSGYMGGTDVESFRGERRGGEGRDGTLGAVEGERAHAG